MNLWRRAILIAVLFLATSVGQLRSAAPSLLNYQGVLRDSAGDLVPDGNYSVTFRIWDSETSGAALWQEGRLVAVQDGLFTVLLGSIVPIPDTLFSNPDRWIGLQVGLDAEMTPRQRLVSVPYAWESQHAANADSATHSRDKTRDAGEIVYGILDTARYSAYEDLVIEGRIGTNSNQLAQGNLVSPFRIAEDSSTNEIIISEADGVVTLKTLSLPVTELGNYMHVRVPVFRTCLTPSNSSLAWTLNLNGTKIGSSQVNCSSTDHGTGLTSELLRASDPSGQLWFDLSLGVYRSIDLTSGALLELTAEVREGSGSYSLIANTLLVIYRER